MTMRITKEIVSNKALLANDLPEGWASTTLEEICEKITDGTHKTPKYVDRGIPFVSTANIIPFRSGFDFGSYQRFITIDEHQELTKRCHPEKGDILVSKCGTIGRAKEVDVDYPFSIFVGLALLKPYNGVFARKFAEYLFNYEQITKEFERLSPGSTRKTLTLAAIKTLKLPMAPLDEQKRIVKKVEQLLARVNAARERLAKVPEILKRFRQSVLAAACSGRLTADWRKKNPGVEPASALLARVVEKKSPKERTRPTNNASVHEDLPETWTQCSLGSLCELITKGSSPKWQGINYVSSGVLFITSENVALGRLSLENKKHVEERFNAIQKRSILEKGDLLTNIVGASIGRSALFDLDERANINQAVALIRLHTDIDKAYILNVLNSPIITDFMNRSKVDVARANLSLKDVSCFPIPLPPSAEQREIVRRVEILFKIADEIQARYEKAKAHVDKLVQSILSKAFRGELVLTEAELALREGRSYEPASALLAKIEAQRKDVKPRRKRKRQDGGEVNGSFPTIKGKEVPP